MLTSDSWQRLPANASSDPWTEDIPRRAEDAHTLPLRKRAFDIALASLSLLALSPLLLLIAVAVAIGSRGPVLYISRRVGRNGRIFPCFKFRTMTGVDTTGRLGFHLRRYGLDELPQLWNVLRGEMSIVGPRPLLACDQPAASYGRLRRFETMPGMTGLWALPTAEFEPTAAFLSPDDTYRRNWSLGIDLAIIVRCLAAALAGPHFDRI